MVTEDSYIIFTDGYNVYSRNGFTGEIQFSGTDARTVIQNSINALGANGGKIHIKNGTYVISNMIIPAPWPNDGRGTLIIEGEGMYNTILKANSRFNEWAGYNGLIGYGMSGVNPKVHQLIMQDLTIDGNYKGVAGGEVPQSSHPGTSDLIALPQAYESSSAKGIYHIFTRVRLYRPSGYGLWCAATSVIIQDSVFDSVGQPDKAVNDLHWDNIGGGAWNDVIVDNCVWKNSAGNYVDFVAAETGKKSRLTFTNNRAYDKQQGGIYAMGYTSIISYNFLQNTYSGSNIGYDAGTISSNRGYNIVTNNILKNIGINQPGAAGDLIKDNIILP
jgi:hypothetical protein